MSLIKDWRLWASVTLIILSSYFLKPNFDNSLDNKINFGLDIQGGYSYLLELDEKEYLFNLLSKTKQNLSDKYKIEILIKDINLEIPNVNGDVVISKEDIRNFMLEPVDRNNEFTSYKISNEYFSKSLSDMTLNSIETIRSRVDYLGNKEISIQKFGLNKILLEIPGSLDENVKEVISKTAKLTFHIENSSISNSKLFVNKSTGEEIRAQAAPNITGDLIQEAQVQFNEQNQPIVTLSFNKEGSKMFSNMTTEFVQYRFAIVLDDNLITAPVIREPITGGRASISGSFTNDEANNLAIILKSGSLPTKISIIQEKQIGPSLGKEGVNKGIYASIISLLSISLFMIIYYRLSGLYTTFTIILCLVLLFALMSILNATLTLPGIIGVVLTIGMCVDANVLIFERIRENFKHNTDSPKNDGFNSAFVTILDSNLTTLFAAVFLFAFGFGPIRGFSISLIIGIVSSLIVTYVFLKFFINITSEKYLNLNK